MVLSRWNATRRGLTVACGLIFGLAACGQEAAEDEAPVVRPAKLIEVTTSSDMLEISFPAIIEASSSSDLTFQVGGLLQEFPVIEAEEVEEGAVIARLDQRDFRNQLSQAQAQFDSAKTEYDRAERLAAQDAIAQNVLDQRRTQLDVARATLDSAQKALSDTTLRAPFAGVIAQKHVSQFENVAPQAPIVTLQSTGAAEAAVQIPATLIANSGNIEPIGTTVVLDALPELSIPAEYLSSDGQANPDTQTFAVSFAFTPPDDTLILPGMTGTVRSTLRLAHKNGSAEQITIPLSAVLAEGQDRFVWVVDRETMRVSKRSIAVAGIGENLQVVSGLEAGELIVGAGASYLHEGTQVRAYEG